MPTYIRSGCSTLQMAILECGCHEVQIIKVYCKNNDFCFQFIAILMLMIGILIVFWLIWQPYKKIMKTLSLLLLEILMPITEWLNSISQIDCQGLRVH